MKAAEALVLQLIVDYIKVFLFGVVLGAGIGVAVGKYIL